MLIFVIIAGNFERCEKKHLIYNVELRLSFCIKYVRLSVLFSHVTTLYRNNIYLHLYLIFFSRKQIKYLTII